MYQDFDLLEEVAIGNGSISRAMKYLLGCIGRKRLTLGLAVQISDFIKQQGLDHYPIELPTVADEVVRIYDPRSDVGRLMQIALTPGANNDKKLRDIAVYLPKSRLKIISISPTPKY